MQKFWNLDKETLLKYLLIASLILVILGVFVIFFGHALPLLETVVLYLGVLLAPFAIAWLTAVFTHPMNKWLIQRLHLPASLAVLINELLLLGVLSLLVFLLFSVSADILSNIAHYITNLDQYAGELSAMVNALFERLGLDFSTVDVYLDRWRDNVAGFVSQGMNFVIAFAKSTPGMMVLFFVSLVAVFYWCRDEEKVRNVLCNAFPMRMREHARETYDNISTVIGGYIRAWALLVTISTVLCMTGFAILGVESPIAMGLFAGILDIIPVLGPGTVIVPWGIWSMATGRVGFGVGLLVLYGIVSATRYILEPKVIGDRVGLHPLAAMAAIFIGMKLFGIIGLILGPIVLAVLMTFYRTNRQSKIISPSEPKRQGKKKSQPGPAAPPNASVNNNTIIINDDPEQRA